MSSETDLATDDDQVPGQSPWAPDMAPEMPVTGFDDIPAAPARSGPQDDPAEDNRRVRVATVEKRVSNAVAKIGAGPELSGFCERFVRTCFGFPARYATARLAWLDTKKRHSDMDAPAGVPVFWDITSGKNANADHIAISVGGGYCVSTSAGPDRTVAKVAIKDLTRKWGMVYRGWSEDYHRVTVYTKDSASATVLTTTTTSASTAGWPASNLKVTGKHTAQSLAAWRTLMASIGYKDADLDLAMQRWLRKLGHYAAKWKLDGDFGVQSVKALQRFLAKKGLYTFAIDGDRGPETVKAEIRYLNQQRKYL